MAFTDDLWTVLLTDDQTELEEVLERIADDKVAMKIVKTTLVEPSSSGETPSVG